MAGKRAADTRVARLGVEPQRSPAVMAGKSSHHGRIRHQETGRNGARP